MLKKPKNSKETYGKYLITPDGKKVRVGGSAGVVLNDDKIKA